MLIKCPECELQVSDKAISCPHCGYPLKPDKQPRRSTRRKRLPNGFGQISEIKSKNLRKPFRVLITIGKDEITGRPICKPLKPEAYFKTYNEAYTALVEYNKNPYDVSKDMTVNELFEKWINVKPDVSTNKLLKASWKYCSMLYDLPIRDIRSRHLKQCINEGFILYDDEKRYMPQTVKIYTKTLFNMMFDYAVEYEYVDKNYARDFNLKSVIDTKTDNKMHHIPFYDDEIDILWNNLDYYEGIDMILIQCYSGWRPTELCDLEIENINFNNLTMMGGMKTEAGTNRTIPIHSKIYDLVRKRYKEAIEKKSRFLFNNKSHITTNRYTYIFNKVIKKLNLNSAHRPHDGRVTFVTNAKKYNVDEYAIKYIVGHVITDITEKIYTERPSGWLKEEIEKIK